MKQTRTGVLKAQKAILKPGLSTFRNSKVKQQPRGKQGVWITKKRMMNK
jgi:hypothetical protein